MKSLHEQAAKPVMDRQDKAVSLHEQALSVRTTYRNGGNYSTRAMVNLIKAQDAELQRLRAELESARKDAADITWLQDNEANLITFREEIIEGEYAIWWQVVKGKKSLSGHPLGSPRAAIAAARKESAP